MSGSARTLDFESTVEATLLEWRQRYRLREVRIDPWQMASVAQRLRKAGLNVIQEIGENGMAKNEVIERFAIQDLLARYAHAIDDLNPEEWARCFTPDGVFQLGSQALHGHAALRAYGEVHVREIRCRHMTGNFLYKIDGNKATGQASVLATPGGYKFFAQGRYVDQLVKQRGQWLNAEPRGSRTANRGEA